MRNKRSKTIRKFKKALDKDNLFTDKQYPTDESIYGTAE